MADPTASTPDPVNPGELILYRTDDGGTQIQMRAVDGTVWLTQADMAELFDTTPQNVTQHIRNIYDEFELHPERTCKDLFQVRQEGTRLVRRKVQTYNLDAILAVGYRVRSPRGVQFRQWATTTLREYLVKGFVVNDQRLKEPGGLDYFDELLERIRDIRASEKRFYQKVRDIFATSTDYDGTSAVAGTFFATIQNKLVYAVTGHTAAELIVARCDSGEPNMGLTSWAGSRVRKADVTTSKNYLTGEEISILNQLAVQFLDSAELRAKRRQSMTMDQWTVQADKLLQLNDFTVLTGSGKVSSERMKAVAHEEYERYDAGRRAHEKAVADSEAVAELEEIERQARKGLDSSPG